MSNSDTEELHNTGWFDSESELLGISSVDSTLELGVNMSCPSANLTLARALEIGDSNTTSSDPNMGISLGYVPLGGNGPIKGERFLDTPFHTSPQSKSPSPVPFHCGWSKGRGKEVGREGQKSSTIFWHMCNIACGIF